jgi:hypothetical protein
LFFSLVQFEKMFYINCLKLIKMRMDSFGSPPDKIENQEIPRKDIKKLMSEFRVVFARIKRERSHRIIKRLLKKMPANKVTWSHIYAEEEMDEKVNIITGAIKRGVIFGVLNRIRELGPIDFRNYGFEGCETAMRTEVQSSLQNEDRIKKALEIVRIFGAYIDFTPEIKSAYSGCAADKMNDIAKKIKETFPEIQF